MTNDEDNLTQEPEVSLQAHLHQEELIEDEFGDEEDVLGTGAEDVDDENTDFSPYDIFGLDPLDVMTLEELAEYLKVSPAAVRRAVKDDKLPGKNIGGEWRFLRDAVANWLRCQEAPVVQQQQAREAFSQASSKYTASRDDNASRDDAQSQYARPPRRPYKPEQSERGEYRPRQRFSEGQYPYTNQGNTYRGGQQYGDQARQDDNSEEGDTGGYEARPPRRPFRSYEGRGTGNSQGGAGYGGGYGGGGQRFSGGPKRKNKRQVFDKERGKRMDRRRENGASEGQ